MAKNKVNWVVVSIFVGFLLAVLYVLFLVEPINNNQIDCLKHISESKCDGQSVKLIITPDKGNLQNSGYKCNVDQSASFESIGNDYPRFTTTELNSCNITI